MKLIYLYGPPGVGKYTVGKELSKLTGYKLFHNQLSIEFVRQVFEFRSKPFNKLVLKYRRELIEEAAKNDVSLIFTSAYAKGYSEGIMKDIVRRVERHKGQVCFVQLSCDKKTLMKRVAGRKQSQFYKIKSSKTLDALLKRYDHLSSIPFRKSLLIDNTTMSPNAAAKKIVVHYHLRGSL